MAYDTLYDQTTGWSFTVTEAEKYKKISEEIKRFGRENSATPELARAALIEMGIYTKKGNIKKRYDESIDLKKNAA